jgi:predicted CXXCH cytochrome family protein
MNVSLRSAVSVYALAAVILGVLATAAIGQDAPKAEKADAVPAYMATATYKKSMMCNMCHKEQATGWATTKHASFNKALPWDGDATAKPAAADVYTHVTGYAADGTYAEKGITCEACHGPGSAHMTASKDQKKNAIVDPEDLKTPGQKISVCGRCHGQYTLGDQKIAAKYQFGQDLLKADGFKLAAVTPGKKMQEMNEVVASEHFKHGVVCISCHTSHTTTAQPHALQKPVIELCQSCHKDKDMAKHAPKAAAGATCATCHMAGGSHAFRDPGNKD